MNAKLHAKTNPKNSAKVQEQARVENEKRIAKMSFAFVVIIPTAPAVFFRFHSDQGRRFATCH